MRIPEFLRGALAILSLFCGVAMAAPSVSGHSGATGNGSSVTLSGSGFSAKSPAAPVAWDTFEDGSVNSTATVGSWSDVNSLSIRSSQSRNPFSSYSAGSIFNGVWPTYSNSYLTGGSNSTTWYVQYWLKLSSGFDWSSNIDNSRGNVKFFRMWDTGSDSKNFVVAFHEGSYVCAVVEQCTSAGPTCYMHDYNPTTELDNGNWNLLQFEYRESSAADVADGVWRMWSNGRLVYDYSNLTTKCSGHTSNSRPYIVGLFDSHSAGGSSNDIYIDDAYIDSKWNRVELANSATYTSATIREIQPPTSWSDTSITLTLNRGALSGTVYAFVTDSSGARNATGYPLALDGGTTYTVTPNAGANGSISPNTAQTVNSGSTTAFTVTPNSGYTASVGGTCGGSLVGTTYTTNAIAANCTVSATFSPIVDTVAPVLSGLSPTGEQPTTVTSVVLALITDEAATCRYDLNGMSDYDLMSNYTTTGGTSHSATVAVRKGGIYAPAVKCRDVSGNISASPAWRFAVPDDPKRRGSH